MSNHVVMCRAEDSTAKASELMAKHKIHRIPIIDDDDRPIGVVSLNDLAIAAAHAQVPERDVVYTLGAIHEHGSPPTS
jgi:CBS domain-containing protein